MHCICACFKTKLIKKIMKTENGVTTFKVSWNSVAVGVPPNKPSWSFSEDTYKRISQMFYDELFIVLSSCYFILTRVKMVITHQLLKSLFKNMQNLCF